MATEIYRTTTTIDCKGQMASMVHHWKIIDPSNGNDFVVAGQLIAALNAGAPPIGFVNRLQLLLSEDAFISSITAARLHPTGGNSANKVYQEDEQVGAVESPMHTGQLAGCIIWITSTRSDITGRTFVPGVPESLIVGGRFESAYVDAVNDFVTTFTTGFSTASGIFFPVVWDREAEISYQIDDGYLSSKPGTQRRREKPL